MFTVLVLQSNSYFNSTNRSEFFLNGNLQLSAQSIALHEKILNAFSALCRKVETNQLDATGDYQYWVFEQGHKAAMMQIKELKN